MEEKVVIFFAIFKGVHFQVSMWYSYMDPIHEWLIFVGNVGKWIRWVGVKVLTGG